VLATAALVAGSGLPSAAEQLRTSPGVGKWC
jgi:hypothetical protein